MIINNQYSSCGFGLSHYKQSAIFKHQDQTTVGFVFPHRELIIGFMLRLIARFGSKSDIVGMIH